MVWTKTYKKYKDIELMKEFYEYCLLEGLFHFRTGTVYKRIKGDLRGCFGFLNIKDIYGYIKCFAETKNIDMICEYSRDFKEVYKVGIFYGVSKYILEEKSMAVEQSMLWRIDKFFEVLDKE